MVPASGCAAAAGPPMTSPVVLRQSQYGGRERLTARERLWADHGRSRVEEQLSGLALSGTETVLDVGCGYGKHLVALRERGHCGPLVGADTSEGMTSIAARAGVRVVAADAVALPFRDDSVDVALAMQMLYHVADIPAALREIRRVICPGGRLLAATNGTRHVAELRIVMNAAARTATGRDPVFGDPGFTLENGADRLRGFFDHVERYERVDIVELAETEPALAYVASFGPELTGVPVGDWEAYLDAADNLIREHLAQFGTFTVTGLTGFFVCT